MTTRINALDSQLYLECKNGNTEKIKLLLELGASANAPDIEYNISTLAAACMTHCTRPNKKQQKIVELMLKCGGDPSLCDKRGINVLHHLAQFSKDHKMLKLILQSGKVHPDVVDMKSNTPLQLLCKYEQENKAALHKARYLIESGADPTLLNAEGESAICITATKAKTTLLSVLLEKHSVNPNGNILARCTPIDNVAKGYVHHSDRECHFSNYYKCIDLLLDKGADINIKRLSGFHPLFYTIRYRSYAMTKYLLSKGANPNYQDLNGDSALHKAYSYCTHLLSDLADIDKLLLEAGSNPNLVNRIGKVPASSIPYFDFVSSNREQWFAKIKHNLQAGLKIEKFSDTTKLDFLPLAYTWYDVIDFLYHCGHWFKVNTDISTSECVEYVNDLQRQPLSLQMKAAKVIRQCLQPNAIKGTRILNPPSRIAKLITLNYL